MGAKTSDSLRTRPDTRTTAYVAKEWLGSYEQHGEDYGRAAARRKTSRGASKTMGDNDDSRFSRGIETCGDYQYPRARVGAFWEMDQRKNLHEVSYGEMRHNARPQELSGGGLPVTEAFRVPGGVGG
ncbi:hypothetical protein IMY05_C4560000300 [Salix suchowensis]|nr:hypothetical protein IMY05_C4560000300 [Salix suchowensis]